MRKVRDSNPLSGEYFYLLFFSFSCFLTNECKSRRVPSSVSETHRAHRAIPWFFLTELWIRNSPWPPSIGFSPRALHRANLTESLCQRVLFSLFLSYIISSHYFSRQTVEVGHKIKFFAFRRVAVFCIIFEVKKWRRKFFIFIYACILPFFAQKSAY